MNLRRFLFSILAAAACSAAVAASAAERRPNVILIMADDFGYECVTANGGESYRTPHLDRLAATGARFEHCYVQPLCTPTRAQLMTGLYNVRNYIDFGTLDPQATTFGHLFKRAGYVTGVAGKWQLGARPDLPQHFGFDESYLWQHTREGNAKPARYANPGLEHNGRPLDFTRGEYGPDLVQAFAVDFVTRHRGQPFFLYYPMILTHDPFQPTPDSADWDPKTTGEREKRDLKHFADMTAHMDKHIGELVAKLESLGLRDNTLLVFLGDNGTHPTVTSQFKGKPYQGGKGGRTARGNHVPLIVNWPGRVPAGTVNADLVASVDFLPTLCAAAGIPLAKDFATDGVSFWPQARGEKGTPRAALYTWYVRNGGPTPQWEFAMSRTHKLYRDGTFVDLRADPFEERPLRAEQQTGAAAAEAAKLQAELDRFRNARPAHVLKPIDRAAAKKAVD